MTTSKGRKFRPSKGKTPQCSECGNTTGPNEETLPQCPQCENNRREHPGNSYLNSDKEPPPQEVSFVAPPTHWPVNFTSARLVCRCGGTAWRSDEPGTATCMYCGREQAIPGVQESR